MASGQAGKRLAWILGLTSLALLAALGAYLAPLKPHILALQFAFDESTFRAVLEAWRPEGVLRYRAHLFVDDGLLLCYGAFGYVLASKTAVFACFSAPAATALRWVMPMAALCDAVENTLHWQLTSGAPAMHTALYGLAGLSSTLKLVLIGVFGVCLVRAWFART